MHLLIWVDDALQLARFMGYVNSNFGREVARLRKWPDKVFSRRYQAIPVSNEEGAQVGRLKYVLSQDYASYCTSLSRGSSEGETSIWYMTTPRVTECVRTRPSAAHC